MKSQSALADKANSEMRVLCPTELSAVNGGEIKLITQAYQAFMTCLKSCADSKGEVQKELARFR